MVLAKADMEIGAHYAQLAGDTGEEIFQNIQEEYQRTVEHILTLKDNTQLLDDDPTLQRAIRLRNPYVDPMSLLQVDLLRRWRETDRQNEEIFDALLATVNGIAEGLQNTGEITKNLCSFFISSHSKSQAFRHAFAVSSGDKATNTWPESIQPPSGPS